MLRLQPTPTSSNIRRHLLSSSLQNIKTGLHRIRLDVWQVVPVIRAMSSNTNVSEPSQSGSSKKRPGEVLHPENATSTKITKIHPFFTKGQDTTAAGPFRWVKPLGPKGTCLHGVNLNPRAAEKVAVFDLDGTLIASNHNNRSKSASLEWKWWRSGVPKKLKEVYDSGYCIIIVSNQAIKGAILEGWKKKIPLIASALPDVPFRLFAATARDNYRKPMPGTWFELERIFSEEGVQIDKSVSFFVGDAAGRQYQGGGQDFASTDRKWAMNIGLSFYTPEEYFLNLLPVPFKLPGFHVSSLPDLPLFTPTSSPLLPNPNQLEIVLFVGYPCLGKSSFYRRHFQPAGYNHINQDTLGTRIKCVKAVQESILDGKSCVVDNTNRDIPTRKHYIELAKKSNIPVRCFLFTGSIDLAWHNNLYRTYNLPPSAAAREPKRVMLPYLAFSEFHQNYEPPQMTEGFSEIKEINWVFQGSEEEKAYWSMWLQIDGK